MKRSWRYLIPSMLTIVYILLSTFLHYYYIYAILLIANILNAYWGEFRNSELPDELRYFYRSSNAVIVKTINAIVLIFLIVWGVLFIDQQDFTFSHLLGFSFTTGVLTGCFIVTLAHDLLHSQSVFQKGLSVILLICSGIPHFATEHLCGHHRDIGLREDATTARLNQNFYQYFINISFTTLYNCYITQFGLPRYIRKKIRFTNMMMLGLLFLTWALILYFSQNPKTTLAFFIIQGFVSYFLYELINYIQHYGLSRNSREDKVTLHLSWNCYYKYTNYILFLLPLHSLHHLHANERKITDFKAGPRMPYLYFLMITMALIPPLWFRKMNRLALQYQQ